MQNFKYLPQTPQCMTRHEFQAINSFLHFVTYNVIFRQKSEKHVMACLLARLQNLTISF